MNVTKIIIIYYPGLCMHCKVYKPDPKSQVHLWLILSAKHLEWGLSGDGFESNFYINSLALKKLTVSYLLNYLSFDKLVLRSDSIPSCLQVSGDHFASCHTRTDKNHRMDQP